MFRRAAWLSAGLHVVVVLVVYFGIPDLFDREVVVEPSIRVEVYTIAEETAAPPPAPKPEVEPEPEAPPPPEPEPEVAAVEPPPPEPEPEPEPEPPPPPEPEVVEPEPEPEPVPEPEPEPEPEPQPVVAAAPAPRTKPKPPVKPVEDFSSVLETVALLDKSLEEPPPAPQQETMLDLDALEGALAPNVAARVTLSEIDAIRRQIEDNWIVPAGAPEAEDLQVEIRIQLAVDGRVLRADIVDQARMVQTGEEFYRSAAESALRAVLKASPLHGLPPEKYDAWRDITMTFDPSKMVGQ